MAVTEVGVSRGTGWVHSGVEVYNAAAPTSMTSLDLSGTIGTGNTLVLLKIKQSVGANRAYAFRQGSDTEDMGWVTVAQFAGGCASVIMDSGKIGYVWIETDTDGTVDWICSNGTTTTVVTLMGYIKE